jgi:hypothetical protein
MWEAKVGGSQIARQACKTLSEKIIKRKKRRCGSRD